MRLGHDDSAIHLSHCLSGLLGGGEAHEPKSFGATFLVHDLSGSDGAVRSKFLPQSLIINSVIQILDIKVDTLISIQPLKLQLLKLLLQLLLSFSFLLSPANIQSLAKHFNTIEFFNGFLCRLRILERHKSESFVLSRFISHDLSTFGMLSKILLLLTLLAGNKSADEDFLLVQQHAIDLLDSVHGGLFRLEVNESITLAASISILSHLTGQDISESREGVVHGLVVDGLVQVLDEDITDSRSPEGGITLAPHDPDWATLQDIEVHCIKSSFSIGRLLKVDVGIAQGPSGDHVPADPDG